MLAYTYRCIFLLSYNSSIDGFQIDEKEEKDK